MVGKDAGLRRSRMSNKLFALNVIYTIADLIVAVLCVCGFCWGAWNFEKWWMLCFCIIPLLTFSTHSAIVDADIEAAQKGDENDS